MTAKEWRKQNSELAQNGNIRDYTDLLHLIILSNNARLQMNALKNNKNISELELL